MHTFLQYVAKDIIAKHEAVHEVAVIGVADDKWGERPLALDPVVRTEAEHVVGLAALEPDHARLAALGQKVGVIGVYPAPTAIEFTAGELHLKGVPVAAADFAVDASTGLVTLATAPAAGQAITAGFLFDVPVRFDTDQLTVSLDHFGAGSISTIPLVEVRS